MTERAILGAQLSLGALLSLALALTGPASLAAQDVAADEADAEPTADELSEVFADEGEEESSNLWWFPGVLGIVAAAVSVSGFVNVRAELEVLKDDRTQAELCAADRDSPACTELGPFGRALLEAGTDEDVCTAENAETYGITELCEQRSRHQTRKRVYLTVGTLGLLVGIASFVTFGLLQRRSNDAEARAARLVPWLSLGAERSAGLALDLTF